jgi:alkaline phosphatase D
VKLADGTIWRNLVLPGKDKVAETLDEYRANYRYNYLDENLRRFYAETAVFAQWDDHEVRNNWFPGQVIPDSDTRYKERSVDLLAAYASRAFLEYQPLRLNPVEPERVYRSYRYGPDVEVFILDERSYRGPNTPNNQPERNAIDEFLGQEQLAWLKTALVQSPATWKIMASDMPVSLFVADPLGTEAWANNQPGPPLGRELQLAEILKFIRDNQVRNVVWLTADVHYAAAHFYEPSRARLPTSSRSGSSWPVPCTPAPSARTRSIRPSDRRWSSTASPTTSPRTRRPRRASSSSASAA